MLKRNGSITLPRLLTRRQAAEYCGISASTFTLLCPVAPIALNHSKRLHRYDIRALDAWIDTLTEDGLESGRDWLAAMGGNDGARSH